MNRQKRTTFLFSREEIYNAEKIEKLSRKGGGKEEKDGKDASCGGVESNQSIDEI